MGRHDMNNKANVGTMDTVKEADSHPRTFFHALYAWSFFIALCLLILYLILIPVSSRLIKPAKVLDQATRIYHTIEKVVFFVCLLSIFIHFISIPLAYLTRSFGNRKMRSWSWFTSLVFVFLAIDIIVPARDYGRVFPEINDCQFNLQLIDKALIQYADDHKGCIPASNEFYKALCPEYLESHCFQCPSVSSDLTLPHYALNQNVSDLKLNELPCDIVLCYELDPVPFHPHNQFDLIDQRRHCSGSNILFANGKIELIEPDMIEKLRWQLPE